MTWNIVWTGIISFLVANITPFVVQILKLIIPPRFRPLFKGVIGPYTVWFVCVAIATVQLAAQGKLSPVPWHDPVAATGVILGVGSLISQYAQNLYRAAEPFFKRILEMLGS